MVAHQSPTDPDERMTRIRFLSQDFRGLGRIPAIAFQACPA